MEAADSSKAARSERGTVCPGAIPQPESKDAFCPVVGSVVLDARGPLKGGFLNLIISIQ